MTVSWQGPWRSGNGRAPTEGGTGCATTSPGAFLTRDEGHLQLRSDAAPYLENLGWHTLAAVLASTQPHIVRQVDERDNCTLELPATAPCPRAYLKRHRSRKLRPWLAAVLTGRAYVGPGVFEFQAARRCAAAGVPVLEPLAVGERVGARPWHREGFFLSAQVPGIPADDFWKQYCQYSPGSSPTGTPPTGESPAASVTEETIAAQRLAVLESLARTARLFHAARAFHRDFYWCHFFVSENPLPSGETTFAPSSRATEKPRASFTARLIDLQRVTAGGLFPARWRFKDLAQFVFSMPGDLTTAERLYWWACYVGQPVGQPLRAWARLYWRLLNLRAAFYRWKERRA